MARKSALTIVKGSIWFAVTSYGSGVILQFGNALRSRLLPS